MYRNYALLCSVRSIISITHNHIFIGVTIIQRMKMMTLFCNQIVLSRYLLNSIGIILIIILIMILMIILMIIMIMIIFLIQQYNMILKNYLSSIKLILLFQSKMNFQYIICIVIINLNCNVNCSICCYRLLHVFWA